MGYEKQGTTWVYTGGNPSPPPAVPGERIVGPGGATYQVQAPVESEYAKTHWVETGPPSSYTATYVGQSINTPEGQRLLKGEPPSSGVTQTSGGVSVPTIETSPGFQAKLSEAAKQGLLPSQSITTLTRLPTIGGNVMTINATPTQANALLEEYGKNPPSYATQIVVTDPNNPAQQTIYDIGVVSSNIPSEKDLLRSRYVEAGQKFTQPNEITDYGTYTRIEAKTIGEKINQFLGFTPTGKYDIYGESIYYKRVPIVGSVLRTKYEYPANLPKERFTTEAQKGQREFFGLLPPGSSAGFEAGSTIGLLVGLGAENIGRTKNMIALNRALGASEALASEQANTPKPTSKALFETLTRTDSQGKPISSKTLLMGQTETYYPLTAEEKAAFALEQKAKPGTPFEDLLYKRVTKDYAVVEKKNKFIIKGDEGGKPKGVNLAGGKNVLAELTGFEMEGNEVAIKINKIIVGDTGVISKTIVTKNPDVALGGLLETRGIALAGTKSRFTNIVDTNAFFKGDTSTKLSAAWWSSTPYAQVGEYWAQFQKAFMGVTPTGSRFAGRGVETILRGKTPSAIEEIGLGRTAEPTFKGNTPADKLNTDWRLGSRAELVNKQAQITSQQKDLNKALGVSERITRIAEAEQAKFFGGQRTEAAVKIRSIEKSLSRNFAITGGQTETKEGGKFDIFGGYDTGGKQKPDVMSRQLHKQFQIQTPAETTRTKLMIDLITTTPTTTTTIFPDITPKIDFTDLTGPPALPGGYYNLDLGALGGKRQFQKPKQPKKYMPDIASLLTGAKGKAPKILTGIERRPIDIKKIFG